MALGSFLRTVTPPRTTVAQFIGWQPNDNDEVILEVDPSASVYWHLRYRIANTTTNKWEFVGGSPLYAVVETDDAFQPGGGGAWIDFSSVSGATVGPDIQIPVPGLYNVDWGAVVSNPATSSGGITAQGTAQVSPGGAANGGDPDFAQAAANGIWTSANSSDISIGRSQQRSLSSGRLRLEYRSGATLTGSANVHVSRRYMRVQPVRVRPQ